MKFPFVLLVLLAACGDKGSILNQCPYSGAASDCATIADNTVGVGGICEGIDTVDKGSLESTCDGLSGEYSDCWRACVESAGSCDDALTCQDDCYYCG